MYNGHSCRLWSKVLGTYVSFLVLMCTKHFFTFVFVQRETEHALHGKAL